MTTSRVEEGRGRFRKGRTKTGGRRRGTPNRATRAVKEFLSEILNQADVQDAIRDRILKGDTSAFFKAIEIVHGKPRQAVEVNQALAGGLVVRWQDDLATRLKAGRRRVADGRSGSKDD
jgi:hypothetical protein